jgi:hypothetical protein
VTLTIYADFDSVDCYLAARRAAVLWAAGVAVDWRAVQRRPERPVTGSPLAAGESAALVARFTELDALLLPGETLPQEAPTFAPNTEAAVSAYAEAYGSAAADDVLRLLFDLYWVRRADIGNPNVLRTPLAGPMLRANTGIDSMNQTGYAVSVSRGPIGSEAHRRISAWRDEWHQLHADALPVVLVDGATVAGTDALRRLGKEILYRDADLHPRLTDPQRYPAVGGRPSPAWVSEIGGRWRHVYQHAGGH